MDSGNTGDYTPDALFGDDFVGGLNDETYEIERKEKARQISILSSMVDCLGAPNLEDDESVAVAAPSTFKVPLNDTAPSPPPPRRSRSTGRMTRVEQAAGVPSGKSSSCKFPPPPPAAPIRRSRSAEHPTRDRVSRNALGIDVADLPSALKRMPSRGGSGGASPCMSPQPRRRSAELSRKVRDSVLLQQYGPPTGIVGGGQDRTTTSSSSSLRALGGSLDALKKDVNAHRSAGVLTSSSSFDASLRRPSSRRESDQESLHELQSRRPSNAAIEHARSFLWDDDVSPSTSANALDPSVSTGDGHHLSASAIAQAAIRGGGGGDDSDSSWRRSRDDAGYVSSFYADSLKAFQQQSGADANRSAKSDDMSSIGDLFYGSSRRQLRTANKPSGNKSSSSSGSGTHSVGTNRLLPTIRGFFDNSNSSLNGSWRQNGRTALDDVDIAFTENIAPARDMYGKGPGHREDFGLHNKHVTASDPYVYGPTVSLSDRMLDAIDDIIDALYFGSNSCLSYFGRNIWKILFLLSAVVIVIGSIFYTGTLPIHSSSRGEPSGSSSPLTMSGAVGQITDGIRFNTIMRKIIDKDISDESDFLHPTSVQSRALFWISETDEAKLPETHPYLVQRYALAVFFFQASDAHMASDEGHHRVLGHSNRRLGKNEFPVVDPSKAEAVTGWVHADNWMSKAGHCSWYGISCLYRSSGDLSTSYDGTNGVIGFNMTHNRVSGHIPKEIIGLKDVLGLVDLSKNSLRGEIPSQFGGLQDLRSVFLVQNELVGTIPSSLGQLSKCIGLHLSKNRLSGPLPQELSNLKVLLTLSLHHNNLTGEIPDLSTMQNLRALYLDSNQFSSTIPSSLGNLKSLLDLRLGGNILKGQIPKELGALTQLRDLHIQNNDLTGSLPVSFAGLKNLHEFHAYSNKLSSIPKEIGLLGFFSSLRVLYLDDNKITGTIPQSIGNLGNLVDLYLSNNRIQGSVPPSISKLSKLKNLRLNSNSITGVIPFGVQELQQLENLYLQENMLQGNIPQSLGKLTNLYRLRLHGNRFKDVSMPKSVCALRRHFLEELQADCSGAHATLYGVECSCCTTCF